MSHVNTQLRITPWPDQVLPLPPRGDGIRAVFDPTAAAFFPDFDGGWVPTTPSPGDTYLELASLDTDDIDGIANFLTNHGELGVRGQYTVTWQPWELLLHPPDEMIAQLDAALGVAFEVDPSVSDTLLEIQWAILTMRDMIAAWRALQGEIDATTHAWESPVWKYRSNPPGDTPPWTPDGPASLLSEAFDTGLRPFSPHVRTFLPGKEPVATFAGEAPTWHICCAELFNHIVEEAEYKTCANETCGRLFVRQQGRAEHGQHRTTGVKYCSSDCARAQAQRAYRRRKRSAP